MHKSPIAVHTKGGGVSCEKRNDEKQTSKYKGFYTAIGISILMIGAACVYAYQVTMETNQT